MVDHWKENGPPVYMAVAAYLGMTKPSNRSNTAASDEEKYGNLEDLARMFEATGGSIQ